MFNCKPSRTARRRIRKQQDERCLTQKDDDCINLLRWMKKSFNFKPHGLKVADFAKTGRGILAKRTLHAGDAIVSVPRNALIGVRKACKDSILVQRILSLSKTREKIGKINGTQALCLLLIEEQRKLNLDSISTTTHATTKWGPYIKVLPTGFNHPLYWEAAALEFLPFSLQHSAVENLEKVNCQIKILNELVSLVIHCGVLKRYGKSLCACLSQPISFAEYRWAWCCVNTRCVYSGHDRPAIEGLQPSDADNYYLVPFLDLLNHSTDAKVKANFNEQSNNFEIIALEKCDQYKQVFIHYGAHSNATLLLEYGFISSNDWNENDTVPVVWDEIAKGYNFGKPGPDSMLSILRKHSVDGDWCFCFNGPSWSLIAVTLVLEMSHGGNNIEPNFANIFGRKTNSPELIDINVLNSARQKLSLICNDKIDHCDKKIARCHEMKDQMMEEHIAIIESLCNIYKSVLKTSLEYIQSSGCFADFIGSDTSGNGK